MFERRTLGEVEPAVLGSVIRGPTGNADKPPRATRY
jgi:hypothetical protein